MNVTKASLFHAREKVQGSQSATTCVQSRVPKVKLAGDEKDKALSWKKAAWNRVKQNVLAVAA